MAGYHRLSPLAQMAYTTCREILVQVKDVGEKILEEKRVTAVCGR